MNNVDKTEEYSYEYWFQFENLDDTCSFQLTEKIGKQPSTFEIFDNQNDAIVFANIRLENIETDSIINLHSDFNGKIEILLEKGNYKIEISAINYDNFELEIEVESEEFLEFIINLGLAPELEVYQIDSKVELEESEIIQIIDCVKMNRREFYENCSDKKRYRIIMQI